MNAYDLQSRYQTLCWDVHQAILDKLKTYHNTFNFVSTDSDICATAHHWDETECPLIDALDYEGDEGGFYVTKITSNGMNIHVFGVRANERFDITMKPHEVVPHSLMDTIHLLACLEQSHINK